MPAHGRRFPDRLCHYDAVGRVSQRTVDPSGAALATLYGYDANGNVTGETTPAGNVITRVYDAVNRMTSASDSIGAVEGREYDANGNLTTLLTADDRETVNTYDALDRLTTVTDRLDQDTTFTYDDTGHELTRTDRNGHTSTTVYDAVYRRTNFFDGMDHETRFGYDAVGNLTTLTAVNLDAQQQEELQVTTYQYDNANRRTTEIYPAGGADQRVYTYSDGGDLLTRTDQNGDVTTYTYDDLHRLTGRSYSRGQNSVSYPTTQGPDAFTYDRTGRMLTASHVQGGDTFALTFSYDAPGRVTSVDQDGNTVTHDYTLSGNDRFVETDYPGSRTIRHNLDERLRVESIDDLTGIITLATNAYDLDNRLTTRGYGNATSADWEYDDEDRVLAIMHDAIDLAYGRDAEGNPTYCRHNHATTTSELYGYDATDRLTSFARGTLNAGGTAIEGTPAHTQDWTLDRLRNPFMRQGIIRDWETRNDDNRHRWYGPGIGRWVREDPLRTRSENYNHDAA